MSAERVIEIARGELGQHEYPPGSNHIGYWNDYDERMQGQPWCLIFLWWCFRKAGERMAFFAGAKTASCGTYARWCTAQSATVPITEVRPGDIVLLNFHGGSSPEHCGLVIEVLGFGLVKTIEGNTSPGEEGSQDNGGCVAQKTRTAAQIVLICRPDYKEEEPVKSDYEKHWAREDIEWAKAAGYVKGYPDGTFHPDEGITRAESVAIQHRVVDHLLGEIAALRAELEGFLSAGRDMT